ERMTDNHISQNQPFIVDMIGPVPDSLNVQSVRSATQYLVMAHLSRPLTRLNKNAQIEGDLADRWEIDSQFLEYRFRISARAKWSDGNSITAEQVADSFNRQRKIG